jgi:hypothetical protein
MEHSFKHDRIYPRLKEIRELSVQIAKRIAEECYKEKTAGLYPEPVDKEAFIRSQVYNVDYERVTGLQYDWPKHQMVSYFFLERYLKLLCFSSLDFPFPFRQCRVWTRRMIKRDNINPICV